MDFADVVRKRRMVRTFSEEPVDAVSLERIVAAAQRGPSAGYSQGVEFVVLTRAEQRQALAALVTNRETAAEAIARAPVHIAICSSADIYKERYREPDKMAVRRNATDEQLWQIPFWHVDAGCALMLTLLATVNEGLDASFIGVWRQDAVRELLNMPDGYEITGVVMIGHRAESERLRGSTLSRTRRGPSEVVHYDGW